MHKASRRKAFYFAQAIYFEVISARTPKDTQDLNVDKEIKQ